MFALSVEKVSGLKRNFVYLVTYRCHLQVSIARITCASTHDRTSPGVSSRRCRRRTLTDPPEAVAAVEAATVRRATRCTAPEDRTRTSGKLPAEFQAIRGGQPAGGGGQVVFVYGYD